MAPITALPQAKAALIRKLVKDKNVREQEGLFLLEGETPIRELIREPGDSISAVVMSSAFLKRASQDLLRNVAEHPSPAYLCPEPMFTRLSDVKTSPGLLAVIRRPRWNQEAVFAKPKVLGLFGERIQDPTNVGSLIRSAVALGADAVWLSPDSADPYSPKVARGSAGALLRLPIFTATDPELFLRQRCTVVAAEPRGEKSRALRTVQSIPARTVLALGNERQGLSSSTLKAATLRVHIPTASTVQSLNVAAAAAICLFYLTGLPRTEA